MLEFGEPRPVAGNQPLALNDSELVWYVEQGAIDVLAAEYERGHMVSPYKHFFRLKQGRVAFGADAAGHSVELVARGLPDSRLRCMPRQRLLEALAGADRADGIGSDLRAQVDAWVENMAAAVARDVEGIPATELRLSPGHMTGSGVASSGRGVVWLAATELDASFLDLADIGSDALTPVTPEVWVRVHGEARLDCKSTAELDRAVLLGRALPGFHDLALGAESLNRRLLMLDEANLQVAQTTQRRREKARARRDLETLHNPRPRPEAEEGGLERALRMVGAHESIDIRPPVSSGREELSLSDYCEASAVRMRRVRLSAEKRWWLGDSGAMLAFAREDRRPVVLLPGPTGRYRVVDPATGKTSRADEKTADRLRDVHFLYPRLRTAAPTGLRDLFRTGSAGAARDLALLALTGMVAGVLALAPAFAVSVLVGGGGEGEGGDAAALFQLAAVLIGLGAVAALSHILRGTVLMRLEGRLAARLGAAIWDRLLRLQPDFFRRYSAGELSAKSMTFQDVRDHVSGVAADGVLSTLFLLPALGLLFHYSVGLGWAVAVLAAGLIAVTVVVCLCQIEPQRRYLETSNRLAGDVHHYLNGIAKLRSTGAEDSAFAAWARRYRIHKSAEIRMLVLGEHLAAFGAAAPALASVVLFAVVAARGAQGFDTANFLVVYIAAMVLCSSIAMLGNSARAIASIQPACEQVVPILSSPAATGSAGRDRPMLMGEILIDRVSFAYPESGSKVLEDVSIRVGPGEFVAIVGESGTGKSTLFRLALGLETPDSGAIYYDGRNLSELDLAAVRRQVGVVLQDGDLQHGTVRDNILGIDDEFTEDDAWRAARQAGVAEDIRAMPMGLYTPVGENSATFSGGQSQRIRIAAALVRKPRIIFLDEATSWLDTKSQALTMKGIEESTSTRLVIAQRLSTIRMAHRIHVLQGGRVVQSGRYEELFEVEGPFRDLALRQMA